MNYRGCTWALTWLLVAITIVLWIIASLSM